VRPLRCWLLVADVLDIFAQHQNGRGNQYEFIAVLMSRHEGGFSGDWIKKLYSKQGRKSTLSHSLSFGPRLAATSYWAVAAGRWQASKQAAGRPAGRPASGQMGDGRWEVGGKRDVSGQGRGQRGARV
jgi:hypothetical protein